MGHRLLEAVRLHWAAAVMSDHNVVVVAVVVCRSRTFDQCSHSSVMAVPELVSEFVLVFELIVDDDNTAAAVVVVVADMLPLLLLEDYHHHHQQRYYYNSLKQQQQHDDEEEQDNDCNSDDAAVIYSTCKVYSSWLLQLLSEL